MMQENESSKTFDSTPSASWLNLRCTALHASDSSQKQQILHNTQYEKWGKILNDHNYKEQVKTVDTAQISYATHNQTR